MDPKRIAGPVKAAILIHGLGKPLAETLLKQFTEVEQKRVQEHLAQIRTISPDVVKQVAREFAAIVRQYKSRQAKFSSGGRSAADTDAGDSAAETSGLEAIRTLNADQIYDLIKDEQPQTI